MNSLYNTFFCNRSFVFVNFFLLILEEQWVKIPHCSTVGKNVIDDYYTGQQSKWPKYKNNCLESMLLR